MVSGSVMPYDTTADAPRKRPASSLATAATEAILEFFDTAASTLIFATPCGGEIHRSDLIGIFFTSSGRASDSARSVMYLSTNSGGCTPRATRAMARGSAQKIAEEAQKIDEEE